VDEPAFDEAAAAWRSGRYTKLVTAGGPVERDASYLPFESYAERGAEQLRARGVPADAIAAVAAPASAQERTFLSAVMVRDWAAKEGLEASALDVFSQGPHARRSWRLYRLAFGDRVEVGIHAAPPDRYDPAHWWRTSAGAKDVLTEGIGFAWTACCFRPAAPGSRDEKWGARR
jgi:hypothetical protein